MLYSEFVQGTGCRENDHNYQVYKNLEVMYMNTNMSKQEIYEYGKKLVDNSKSEEQLAFEKQIKEEIQGLKYKLQQVKQDTARYTELYRYDKSSFWKDQANWSKQLEKEIRREIDGLKWVLAE